MKYWNVCRKALYLFTLINLTLLTGCAGIPYEKPEDQISIQKDLSVRPDEIVTMSQVTWCTYPYGDMIPCHPQDALAVQTRTKLILASYSGQHYKPDLTVTVSDVMCAHLYESRETSPNFYLFTKEYGLQIWTFDVHNKPDMKKKKLMLDIMVQPGKKAYVGPEGNFVEASGRTSEATYVTKSPAIVYTTNTEIMQMINPCGGELKKEKRADFSN
ncbi:hypothetical protein KV572_22370 [Pseudomonas yamanorum]|mgnify:CR=1 FL=1|jgi:hypothetical protein|uniref:Lipoprotein n=1 Tax=Pseudomonas yamanorum TaxID=515393 RepID=A0A1H2GKB9_9PSED|nr:MULTISPECIES: hypothetical protein [Pseudomonas]MBV6663704.1 hypothetical protein [Pseudomonas yamanorum]NVZ86622.1 hypothetical protein [Pseudomonas yamanorum]NWD41583.1 hypothetical protein [Pseudomonas yamanorum]WVN17355.1 hypothetical protein VYI69_29020 [Pseudomonas yamanorum]SDU20093.1 hypothetical protein SAMN05216237_3140 [Pseudomonas yamanorum]